MKIKFPFVKGGCVLLLVLASCTHKETRQPAAVSLNKLTSDRGVQALSEILGGDSPVQTYRRPMKIDFYVRGDGAYLSETAKKSLQEALMKTLSGNDPEQGLAKAIGTNLKDAALDNFVKTMKFYKLINVGLQAEISFLPEPNSPNKFDQEFSSNQLVRLDETGALSKKWKATGALSKTQSIYNNSAYVPVQQGKADLVGGAVTLYVEILEVMPRLKIPRITQNGVKGYVRYRRYYRVNQTVDNSMLCDSFAVTKKSPANVPLFYTMDLYKNFNLKNIIPTDETLEIFPGLLPASTDGRAELLPKANPAVGEAIKTAAFSIEQTKGSDKGLTFSLEKIVYNLKEQRLDKDKTQIRVVANPNRRVIDSDANQQFMINSNRDAFIEKCQSSMQKYLKLDEISQGDLL